MCTVHDGEPELAGLSRLQKSQIKGLLRTREVALWIPAPRAVVTRSPHFVVAQIDAPPTDQRVVSLRRRCLCLGKACAIIEMASPVSRISNPYAVILTCSSRIPLSPTSPC